MYEQRRAARFGGCFKWGYRVKAYSAFLQGVNCLQKTTARHESSPLGLEINATISQIADFLIVKTHSTAVM
jgi:hypothetical protein